MVESCAGKWQGNDFAFPAGSSILVDPGLGRDLVKAGLAVAETGGSPVVKIPVVKTVVATDTIQGSVDPSSKDVTKTKKSVKAKPTTKK